MKTTTKKRKTISLPIKMMVGMLLGLAVGMVVGPSIAVIKPLGTAFINLLKMSMVPVVFFSITLSIATVDDLKSFGRFGIKTFIAYVVTTVIAAAVAIFYGFLIKPGAGFVGNISGGAVEREMPTLADTLLGIIPTNIIQSLADGNLVSIIFFCILFGIGIAMLSEERKKPVVDFFQGCLDAVMKMINICLNYAPIGVFALMASMAGQYGREVFSTLGRFLITDFAVEAIAKVCAMPKYRQRLHLAAGEKPSLTLTLRPKEPVLETALTLVEDLSLAAGEKKTKNSQPVEKTT